MNLFIKNNQSTSTKPQPYYCNKICPTYFDRKTGTLYTETFWTTVVIEDNEGGLN